MKIKLILKILSAFVLIYLINGCYITNYKTTQEYFNDVKQDKDKLREFLWQMPKGGDIHLHTDGAVSAESYIKWAVEDQLCVDSSSFTITTPPCNDNEGKPSVNNFIKNIDNYNKMIDALSMRNFKPGKETAHDHFFNTFLKFAAVVDNRAGDMLAETVEKAAEENTLYLELIFLTGTNISDIINKVEYTDNYKILSDKLISAGLLTRVDNAIKYLDSAIANKNRILKCGTSSASKGCGVVIRFIPYTVRVLSNLDIYAQLLFNSELVKRDSRFVSHDLVAPEDNPNALINYKNHISMLSYLKILYPDVKITLHAGELWSPYAEGDNLTFHINDAVMTAKASRIGHGVSIKYENEYIKLLDYMREKQIAVSILLISNDIILNVSGQNHPLPLYLSHNVPIVLSSDDPGVARSDLTSEYLKAVQSYNLTYDTVKMLNRNSIQYSYLSGSPLFLSTNPTVMVNECRNDKLNDITISYSCSTFLKNNYKASIQWELEKRIEKFDNQLW